MNSILRLLSPLDFHLKQTKADAIYWFCAQLIFFMCYWVTRWLCTLVRKVIIETKTDIIDVQCTSIHVCVLFTQCVPKMLSVTYSVFMLNSLLFKENKGGLTENYHHQTNAISTFKRTIILHIAKPELIQSISTTE